MNVLFFEQAKLKRKPIIEDLINCKQFERVFECANEKELEQVISTQNVNVVLTEILNCYETNLPTIIKESGKIMEVLAYIPNELDTVGRTFFKVSDHLYLTKFNPSIEDIICGIKKVFKEGFQNKS